MTTYHVTRSRVVQVPAVQAYALIADYRHGHPRIVPHRFFSDLVVEQGGVGDGTIIQFNTHVLGRTQHFRARVTEPEPGRVLVESNEGVGSVTTFIVDPLPGGCASHVTITTEFAQRPGVAGYLERAVTTLILNRIYAQQIQQIETVARADAASRAATAKAA